MVRAVHEFLRTLDDEPVEVTDDLVRWGASQGARAGFAMDLLGPYYAPEHPRHAAVAMVPPTDLKGTIRFALAELSWNTEVLAGLFVAQDVWYEGAGAFEQVYTDQAPHFFATNLPDDIWADCEFDYLGDATRVEDVFQADFLVAVRADDWKPWSPGPVT